MKRHLLLTALKRLWPCIVSALVYPTAGAIAGAQECESAPLCRETAPAGALLHNPNSRGDRIWTVACKGPDAPAGWSNTSPERLDQICRQISRCSAAGSFGKFLRAVTSDCMSKHFDGYFGLDGMTYGILHWTSNNLPQTLQAYQLRDKKKFDEIFGKLSLPMKNGCLDPNWVCDNNKQGNLMCRAAFHDAFALSLKTAEFQKAQIDQALKEYEQRIERAANLGLKTEYGTTAMAVVANNLRPNESCRPETWKKACTGQSDETELVRCMLQQYAKNSCRGSLRGSRSRMDAINKVFAGAPPSTTIPPTADAVFSCSGNWGRSTN